MTEGPRRSQPAHRLPEPPVLEDAAAIGQRAVRGSARGGHVPVVAAAGGLEFNSWWRWWRLAVLRLTAAAYRRMP
jgi:hypothetical protein